MQLGSFEIQPVRAGVFRLDGGAMFGVVPRVLWEKLVTPDERNRVPMALNCLVVRTPDQNIVVETGMGDKLDKKRREIYGIEGPTQLDAHLASLGVRADDIDCVICTHLHFDHAGGCTKRQDDGSIVPAFPSARYIARREEWEDSLSPDPRSRASYLRENLEPIHQSGQLELIDHDGEIVPGISVEMTGGHTRGHQLVKISSRGKALCFAGDILPTQHHLSAAYIPSYDVFPLETMKARGKVLETAMSEDWLLALPHSVDSVLWRPVEGEGQSSLEPIALEEPI